MTNRRSTFQRMYAMSWVLGLAGTIGLSTGCANPNGCFGGGQPYGPYNGYPYPYPGQPGNFQPTPQTFGTPITPGMAAPAPMVAPGVAPGGYPPGAYGQPLFNRGG